MSNMYPGNKLLSRIGLCIAASSLLLTQAGCNEQTESNGTAPTATSASNAPSSSAASSTAQRRNQGDEGYSKETFTTITSLKFTKDGRAHYIGTAALPHDLWYDSPDATWVDISGTIGCKDGQMTETNSLSDGKDVYAELGTHAATMYDTCSDDDKITKSDDFSFAMEPGHAVSVWYSNQDHPYLAYQGL